MKTLLINSSSNEKIKVGLNLDGKKYLIVEKIGKQKSQIILSMIAKLLAKHKLTIKEIDNIKVNIGPGSFTGLRVGMTIANTLSFTLGVPVNSKNKSLFVEPKYE